jgi:hypothetical protein
LTEITIVLALAGVVIAAIWVAARSVGEKNAVTQAVQELQTVSQNMIALYQNRTLPTPLPGCPSAGSNPTAPSITANVIAAGVIPSVWVVDGACAYATSPWVGGVGAGSVGTFFVYANTLASNSFGIAYAGVKLDGCINLLLQGTSCDPNQPGCPVQVSTNLTFHSISVGSPPPPDGWRSLLTPTDAAALCGFNGIPGSGTNSVEFDFNL